MRFSIFLAVLTFIVPVARSATLIVANTADTGAGSLRQTVVGANSGDTVIFTNTLSGQIILLTSGQIVLTKNVTIDGSGLAAVVQINGNHNSRIFSITNGVTAQLSSLIITNGYALEDGGGIENNGVLTLNNMTITGNRVDWHYDAHGGGIADYNHLTIFNSAIIGNVTFANGGGRAGEDSGGGGIAEFGTGVINNSTIANNKALDYTVGHGGGIDNEGVMVLNNSTVASNYAEWRYAGVDAEYGLSLYMTNTIVCGNTADGETTTLYVSDTSAPFFNNISQPFNMFGYGAANSLYYTNAMLAPPGYYGGATMTMPPLPGSPANDGGSDAVLNFLTTDQRGFAREYGAHVDIGAVEAQTILATHAPLLAGRLNKNNGAFIITFTNDTGVNQTVWATTNLTLPFNQWSNLLAPVESPMGFFTFIDLQATNNVQRFYRVSSP